MENKKDQFERSQQGTGSAENRGEERSRQMGGNKDLSNNDGQNLADEIGEDPSRVGSLKDMGALSGRDDAAGGSGDRMEGQSTGEGTDR
jgi:hypothetical protein